MEPWSKEWVISTSEQVARKEVEEKPSKNFEELKNLYVGILEKEREEKCRRHIIIRKNGNRKVMFYQTDEPKIPVPIKGMRTLEDVLKTIGPTGKSGGYDYPFRRDPIEDDPAIKPIIEDMMAVADASIDPNWVFGRCNWVWDKTKELLREYHGIIWFSPNDMNPGAHFD
jgi:hypothetical protein